MDHVSVLDWKELSKTCSGLAWTASATHPSDLEKRQEIGKRKCMRTLWNNRISRTRRQEMQEISQTGITVVEEKIVQEYDHSFFDS